MSHSSSDGMSRRDVLKLLGIAPLTGALHFTPAEIERASKAMHRADAQAAPDTTHKFFTPHERATASALADIIIPRDERSGSATDARVPEFMDYMLAEASERTRVEMRGGLAWLDAESNKRFGVNFISATPAQRTTIVDDIAWPARARPELSHGVTFFNGFRDYTASGFYSSEMGYKDVRYVGEVFNPNWNGCPPAALNQLGVSYDDHPVRATE